MNTLWKIIYHNSAQHDEILLIGDLYLATIEKYMEYFCDIYHVKNLVKEPTCFKNHNKHFCIYLFLTYCSRSFQDTQVAKQKHNVVFYRNYKMFDCKKSRRRLENELIKFDIINMEFQTFLNILLPVLNENVPIKRNLLEQIMQAFLQKICEKL